MSNTVRNINIENFMDGLFFKISMGKPGNTAKVRDLAALQTYIDLLAAPDGEEITDAAIQNIPKNVRAASALKITYAPIKSQPLADALDFMNATKAKLCGAFGKANPSRIAEGLFLVKKSLVEEFENNMNAAVTELRDKWIPAAVADLEPAKERARTLSVKKGGIGPLFDPLAFPSAAEFEAAFRLEWQWLALGVPDDLPAALRAKEQEKMDRQFAEASEEILSGLRAAFGQLIDHAVEKLSTAPGEKPKIFRDTMIDNIQSFLDVFAARNIMNDQQLAALVDKAKVVMTGMDPAKLRKYQTVRDQALSQFTELKKSLEPLIVTKAARTFDFDEPEPATAAA